jgi:uncharacterized protein (TIGR02678 family)
VIAEDVRDTDLGAYQRAVRTLLVHPLVTATQPNGDALGLVRRFAAPLGRDLEAVAGYRLEVGPTCARLVKRHDRLDPTQVVQPRDRKPFDRRRYAYLALVLGAIVRAGTQVALTEMADALRRRAAEIDGLGFDPDDYRHRLAFVDVALYLEGMGVLRRVESSSVTYLKDPDAGEALYDVDRDAAHQLFVPPRVVQHVGSVRDLLAGGLVASRDTRRAAARQRIARLLLEHPVLYLDDLADGDRAYLRNQARSLADDLSRLTGARLERRGEGIALVDTTGGFSDRRFPGGGTPAQVALLLADAISAAVGHAGALGDPDGSGEDGEATGVVTEQVTVPTLAARAAELADAIDRARPTPPVDVPGGGEFLAPGADLGGYGSCAGLDLLDLGPDPDATELEASGLASGLGEPGPGADLGASGLGPDLDDGDPNGSGLDVNGPGGDLAGAEFDGGGPDRGLGRQRGTGASSPDVNGSGHSADTLDADDADADATPTADPTGPFLPDAWLAATVEGLVATHGKAFAADLRADPGALRRAAVEVLAAFDLVRPVPGGIVARPAVARYRDLQVTTAADPQLSLLEGPTPG